MRRCAAGCSRRRRRPISRLTVFSDVRDALPQTLANLAIVIDMLKRYHKGLEQTLVILPQGAAVAQAGTIFDDEGLLHLALSINQPPPCLTGFLPASEWRSPADTSIDAAADGDLLQDSEGLPGQRGSRRTQLSVRGRARQAGGDAEGVPQQRAVRAAGHQPLVRRSEPDPDLPGGRGALRPGCQARARCHPGTDDQQRDESAARRPAAAARAGVGADQRSAEAALARARVQCSGQQPNPCIYTPAPGPPGSTAVYSPTSGEVVGPDGVRYTVSNSSNPGDDGWKEMLAPAS